MTIKSGIMLEACVFILYLQVSDFHTDSGVLNNYFVRYIYIYIYKLDLFISGLKRGNCCLLC